MSDDKHSATNRAAGPPKKRLRPFVVIRDAFNAHRTRIDKLVERMNGFDIARTSFNQRIDRCEAIARGSKPKQSQPAAPAPKMQPVLLIGPEEAGENGATVRRFQTADADVYLVVGQPAPSPTLGEMRDAFDPNPAPEFKVEAPADDGEPR